MLSSSQSSARMFIRGIGTATPETRYIKAECLDAFQMGISQSNTGDGFSITDPFEKVSIMKNEFPFNDRNQEASWVLINRKNVALNRPARYAVETPLESSRPQSPTSGSHGRKPGVGASPPALGNTHRPRFGLQRSDLDVEYTRTNLG
jgi:hypothetical protein